MANAVKRKKKKPAIEMTLWDVVLSYPDLYEPKPYKGKVYYRTDALLGEDHPQLKTLRQNIKKIKTEAFGPDESEWPVSENPLVKKGDERQDNPEYKGKRYLTPSTQTPVPVVDLKGKPFNAQMVKGGMFANVAIRISAWEFDGDEGISIYLQGVQIDTSKASLNFGGGKSVKQMFSRDSESGDDDGLDDDDSDSDENDGNEESDGDEDSDHDSDSDHSDEDDQPRSKKKKPSKPSRDEDDDEE